MAAIPQKTLNWLWDELRKAYRDPQRAYSDVVQTLALYPGFAPRTNVYTSENGAPTLLLQLSGTIPVDFRGARYQFPITIWVPHAYPYDSPIIYVTPTGDMIVRPGQHVSPSDGRIYHPYLARWREARERSTITDFLKMLADVFAREPPVISRQQMPLQPQPFPEQGQQPPPRIEPRPPGQVASSSVPPLPPPPPPKSNDVPNGTRPMSTASPEPKRSGRYDAPPPLPGQGPPPRPLSVTSPPLSNYALQPQAQRQPSLRQSYPTQPPQPQPRPPQLHQQQPLVARPLSQQYNQQSIPLPSQHQQPSPLQQPRQAHRQPVPLPPQQNRQSYPPAQPPPPQQQPRYQSPAQQQQPPLKPKAQEPNLMDDSPFDVSLTTPSVNLPTPAIPPNPEKQHLLDTLSSTLLQNLHQQITQSGSAVPALVSQHAALSSAHSALQSELAQLKTLQSQLTSNISSLNTTLSSADRVISNAKREKDGNGVPSVDECVIPPTVVARQLYDAVAEQRGYEAAILALTEGFVRGRIGSKVWERKTRECAREEFRRKWMVNKRLAWGLGLDTTVLDT